MASKRVRATSPMRSPFSAAAAEDGLVPLFAQCQLAKDGSSVAGEDAFVILGNDVCMLILEWVMAPDRYSYEYNLSADGALIKEQDYIPNYDKSNLSPDFKRNQRQYLLDLAGTCRYWNRMVRRQFSAMTIEISIDNLEELCYLSKRNTLVDYDWEMSFPKMREVSVMFKVSYWTEALITWLFNWIEARVEDLSQCELVVETSLDGMATRTNKPIQPVFPDSVYAILSKFECLAFYSLEVVLRTYAGVHKFITLAESQVGDATLTEDESSSTGDACSRSDDTQLQMPNFLVLNAGLNKPRQPLHKIQQMVDELETIDLAFGPVAGNPDWVLGKPAAIAQFELKYQHQLNVIKKLIAPLMELKMQLLAQDQPIIELILYSDSVDSISALAAFAWLCNRFDIGDFFPDE